MNILGWFFGIFIILEVNCQKQEQTPKPRSPGEPVVYPKNYCAQIKDYEQFDFIVVGSGPAGSAVARRLAEIPTNQVLLLEAGGDPPAISDIPAEDLNIGLEVRWNYQTNRDKYACLGYVGNTCKYVPGRVLGGSSVVNALMYVRGNKEDFEEWKRMGNYGWGYEDVLPYFKKLENYLAHSITDSQTDPNPNYQNSTSTNDQNASETDSVSSTFHALGGPLTISAYNIDPQTNLVRQAMIKSFEENGVPFNNDINGANQLGVTNLPGMVDPLGYRNNVAKAYLLNIPNNLKVCKNALVHKVIIDSSKTPKVIKSVKFMYSPNNQYSTGKTFHVVARKEYILSAGALNSPGILERSGIGIPKILSAAGVKSVLNLNVGEKYQEQFGNAGSVFALDYRTQSAPNPLTTQLTSLTAFVSFENPGGSVPDIQFLALVYNPAFGTIFKPEIAAQFDSSKKGLLIFGDAILRQTKFGSVHITQAPNPLLSPKIVSNLYNNKRDIDLTVKSTRFLRKVMSTETLKPFKIKPFILNECKKFPINSEDEIMCGARLLPNPLYHQAGTCFMGPADNSSSVVDPELRVIGIKNLRVADLSIMPLVTRGNTEIPAVMIGEKAADMIKKAWGQI